MQGIETQAWCWWLACFDLTITPSVRSWGSDKLILNTRDIEKSS
jgi:hypothetical protein